jgi:aspartyl protease family protein
MFAPRDEERVRDLQRQSDVFSFIPVIAGVLATLAMFVGVGYYVYTEVTATQRAAEAYASALAKVGVSMPEGFTPSATVVRYLDQLFREPCDREAIKPLAEAIESAGYPRESARSLELFAVRCQATAELLEPAYMSYQRLSDYKAAVRVATELIRLDPAYTRWPFLRAQAYEHMKDYRNALNDYVTALQLFTTTSNVAALDFYRVSRMLDAVGKPCEAITPLETYISFDPANRRTDQLKNIISAFSAKGHCNRSYANGADRILMQSGTNIVELDVNGTKGRFIVDTGASLVSMTGEFARRAGVNFDRANVVQTKTAGGTMAMTLGTASRISLGNAQAADVTIAIAPDQRDPYGDRIDGLLGMSFLARFDVSLSAGRIELKHRELVQ